MDGRTAGWGVCMCLPHEMVYTLAKDGEAALGRGEEREIGGERGKEEKDKQG